MLNLPQRPIAPPLTWSQYLAGRRSSRGTVVPPTRWAYPLVLVAALLVMSTSVVTIPESSSLLPGVAQTLWGHPSFLVGFVLTLAACVAALVAGTSRRPRSLRFGLHAGLLLCTAGLTYILGFIDTARRVALLNDNEVAIGNGAIIAGVLGVVALAIAIPDLIQLPDLNRVPILRYAVGYAWAPALAAATMLLVDVRIGSSYAARVSGLTDGGTEGENPAVNAGRLGLAGSGLTYTLVVIAMVLLAVAAIATWVRRPRRIAHVPAALIAGPLLVVAALLLVIEVLQMLVSTSRTASKLGSDLGVPGSDVHLNIAYGGWVLLVVAAGLLVVGALTVQAGLSTPRIPPQLARRGPNRLERPPYAPGRSAQRPGNTMMLQSYGPGLGPAPMPAYVEIPPEFHSAPPSGPESPDAADALNDTPDEAGDVNASEAHEDEAPESDTAAEGDAAHKGDDPDSSATAQYAKHPIPSMQRRS